MNAKTTPNLPMESMNIAGKQYVDACKLQFETGLELLNAMVAGAERIREVQLASARETHEQQQRAAQASASASDVQQLLALEQKLLTDYVSGALQYWTSVGQIAQQTQAEMLKVMQRGWGQAGLPEFRPAMMAGEPAADAMRSAMEAARNASETMMKAWSTALTPPAKPRETKSA